MSMDIDTLFLIAAESEDGGLFDQALALLDPQSSLRPLLEKLEQDVGQAINFHFNPNDAPLPGGRAEEIYEAYKEVTNARLQVIAQIRDALPEGTVKNQMRTLAYKLPKPPPAPSSAPLPELEPG